LDHWAFCSVRAKKPGVRKALGLFGVRLAAVLALAVSAALFVDYTHAVPTFCGANSGCAAVRRSGFGYVLVSGVGVPVPVFGMLAFALLLGVALTKGLQRWLPLVAGIGGLAALFLFGVQAFKIGHLCSLCVTVDSLGVIAAVSGILVWKSEGAPDELAVRWGVWPVLASLALIAPLLWPQVREAPPVPSGVQQLYQAGKINVVEFADYECPYCRALHPLLKQVIASYPGKVNFTRLNLPLQMHEFARSAAQAQVCARDQGKGDAMADVLFNATDLRPETNRAAAKSLGIDLPAYDVCIASGRADKVIDSESKILRDNGFEGLPTTFVGAKTIVGVQPEEVFRDAFDRAERGDGNQGISGPIYWFLILALAGAVTWVGRVRRATL
jgi:protein-disulfide isomerase/uncharacterized membrane protein